MTAKELTELLSPQRLNACPEARKWAQGRTLADAWRDCERGDWLLWLAARAGVRREALVLAACDCARLALPYVPAGETRPLRAIKTAEAWARGEALIDEVRAAAHAAAYAADAAAYAAYAASAVHAVHAANAAAYAAAYAASAASAAAASAAADARTSSAAANAAAYAADAARTSRVTAALARCAELVRARISAEDVGAALASMER